MKNIFFLFCVLPLHFSVSAQGQARIQDQNDVRSYNSVIAVQERLSTMGEYEVCGDAVFKSGTESLEIEGGVSFWSVPVCYKSDANQSFHVSVQCVSELVNYRKFVLSWRASCNVIAE